jgi:hypothetical protein
VFAHCFVRLFGKGIKQVYQLQAKRKKILNQINKVPIFAA